MSLSPHDQEVFDQFRAGVNLIRERTERELREAIEKFRNGIENKSGLAFTPPELKLGDPKLHRLV